MSAVLKLLYGHHPAFLTLKSSKSLFELIATLPAYGRGVLVQPSDWYLKRTKHYFKITRICTASKRIFGMRMKRKKFTKEYEISSKHKHWGFFKPQSEIRTVLDHFKSQSKALPNPE